MMSLVYGATAVILALCIVAAIGYKVADHLDKKYGTDKKK